MKIFKRIKINILIIVSLMGIYSNVFAISPLEVAKIIDEVERSWLDDDNSLQLTPNNDGVSDNENPLLFTAEYLFLLYKLGALEGAIREMYYWRIKSYVDQIRIMPGLFNRRPGQFDRHFSRDEQMALVLIDYVFDYQLGFAKELLDYGRSNDWVFDNQGQSPFFSLDGTGFDMLDLYLIAKRQLGFTAFIEQVNNTKLSNTVNPALAWEVKVMEVALSVTAERPSFETSGKILAIIRLELLKDKHPIFNNLRLAFYEKMKQKYKSEYFLHEILKIYFKHPNHPLRRLSQGLNLKL